MVKTCLSFVYAFLVFYLPFGFSETYPCSKEIDSLAQKTLAEWNIPGLGLAVVYKGKPVRISGYGVKKNGSADPVTEETIFQIASLTKAFTAASVGMLVEEGKLEWEKPIREYLPTFQLKDTYATREMTLRDLLSQRTGLPGTSKQCWRLWYHTGRSTDDLIERLKDIDPAYSFRSLFSYNNMSYVVASKIVEKMSGVTWAQFCRERIFSPLGMKRTTLSYTLMTHDNNAASAHIKGQPIPWDNWENMAAAGGICSSAKDMSKWLLYCLSSPKPLQEAQKQQTLMDPEGIFEPISTLMWPIYAHDEKILSYGYGWIIYRLNDKTVLFHTGLSDGMQSVLAIVPEEELGIAILTNQVPQLGAACLMNELLDRFLQRSPSSWHEKGHKVVQEMMSATKRQEESILKAQHSFKPTVPFSEYVGTYQHPAYGTVFVSFEKDQLELKFWNEEKGILKGVDTNRFVLLDLPSAPTFPWIIEFELSQEEDYIQALKVPYLGVFRKESTCQQKEVQGCHMSASLKESLLLLPTSNLQKTARYYSTVLGFREVEYMQAEQPHICLYRDGVEIVLLQSKQKEIQPNRSLHGSGYDGYFTGEEVEALYEEFTSRDVKIVKPLRTTDYGNQEFVFEDCDGRWIAVGVKQKNKQISKKDMEQKRLSADPPYVTSQLGWRYHHLGIPYDAPKPGETHHKHLKIYVKGFETSPYGIEWIRFEPDCPVPDVLRKIPHIAFEVDDLDEALKGKEVLLEPGKPSDGVRTAMIVHDGALVELIEFKRPHQT